MTFVFLYRHFDPPSPLLRPPYIIDLAIKVGLSPSRKNLLYLFQWKPLKMTKNAFYFILKDLFVLKIFKFLSWLSGHVEK